LCFFCSIQLYAQSGSTVSLKTCLERAQKNSYRLMADEQKIKAAQQKYQLGHSQTLPQFSGELAREQRYLEPYNFRQQWALIHSEWALGDFFLKTASAFQQDVLVDQVKKEQTRLELVRRVSLLYITILQKQIQADLLKKRLDLLKVHHEVAQALWQAGARNQLDVLQTESEISQLKEQMAALELEQDKLLEELAWLMDWHSSSKLHLKPINAAKICSLPIPEVKPENLQSNPFVQVLEFQIKAQRLRLQTIKAQQFPRLQVIGRYMTDGDPTGDGNYWQVTAGINLPLFQWGATKFQRQQSQAIMQSLQLQKKEVERELSIHFEQTLKKLMKLKQILALQNERLKTTEKTFQFAEANYQAGFITNLEYLSAQQQLTETQIAMQKTQLEYVMNLIEFYIITNQMGKIEEIE